MIKLLNDVNSVPEDSKTRYERIHFAGNNYSYAKADTFIINNGVGGNIENGLI